MSATSPNPSNNNIDTGTPASTTDSNGIIGYSASYISLEAVDGVFINGIGSGPSNPPMSFPFPTSSTATPGGTNWPPSKVDVGTINSANGDFVISGQNGGAVINSGNSGTGGSNTGNIYITSANGNVTINCLKGAFLTNQGTTTNNITGTCTTNVKGTSYTNVGESGHPEDSHTTIHGNSTTHVHGNSNSTVHGNTNSISYDTVNSVLLGGTQSVVVGDSSSGVLGNASSLVLGNALSIALGNVLSIALGSLGNFCLGHTYGYAPLDIKDINNAIEGHDIKLTINGIAVQSAASFIIT